ncbi:response regulator [Candidatus Dependentiae bacterium]|nr:response regulator [Candidatus Dependentiae bacterium]
MKIEEYIANDISSIIRSLSSNCDNLKKSDCESEYFDRIQTDIELLSGMFKILSIDTISEMLLKLKEFISVKCSSNRMLTSELFSIINLLTVILSELINKNEIEEKKIDETVKHFFQHVQELNLKELMTLDAALVTADLNFKNKGEESQIETNPKDTKQKNEDESVQTEQKTNNIARKNDIEKKSRPQIISAENEQKKETKTMDSTINISQNNNLSNSNIAASNKFDVKPSANLPKYNKGEFVLNITECFLNMSQDVLSIFIEEVQEIIANLDNRLIELEKDSTNMDLLNLIFRDMHTLKGNSATINFKAMNFIAHRAENTLDKIRKRTLSLTPAITDIMLECVDVFKEMMDNVINNKAETMDLTDTIYKLDLSNLGVSPEQAGFSKEKSFDTIISKPKENMSSQSENKKNDVQPDIQPQPNEKSEVSANQSFVPQMPLTQAAVQVQPPQQQNVSAPQAQPSSGGAAAAAKKIETTSLRVDIQKLNTAMNLIGEIVIDKIRLNQKIKKISDINILINEIIGLIEGDSDAEFEEHFKIEITDKINNYVNSLNIDADIYRLYSREINIIKSTVDKLKREQIDLETFSKKIDKENIVADLRRVEQIFKESVQELLFIVEHLSLVTNDLQESIMKMRMVPVSQLFDKVPRIVRTVSKDLGKKVEIEVIGAETELDKTVIEQLNDPLTHIIRNSVDHGIEKPEARVSKGKPETGTITLKAEHKGNQVAIIIVDDGKGINAPVIVKKALENGLITQEKASTMTKSEILELIFLPGLSSAEKVTEVSGRGVGMDVVLSNIKKLKGTIEIESEIDSGTKITIRLPLTMAIMQVQLIKCSNQIFAIPINFIEEIINIKTDKIMHIGPKRVFNLREEIIPIVELNEILEIRGLGFIEKEYFQITIINISDKRIGFIIDRLIAQQEIVIKSLGNVLKNVKHVTGATILGEGNVILILDILGVYSTAKKMVDLSAGGSFQNLTKSNQSNVKINNPHIDVHKKKILIIDDSSTMRATLKEHLEEAGYATVQAKDGFEAIEKMKNEHIDMFTVDINMPGMNGYELTRKIRELPDYVKKPVIMVSSKSDKIDKMRGLDSGADEYITKPYDKNNLLQLIKKFLE